MNIFKNNNEIQINKNITNITLNDNDYIKITEYVRFFDPKLNYGSLVLVDNTKEIHIDNITNVINTSDAKVEFLDCVIDSMDELFELIKHSLGSEFHIDIQEMVNEDDGSFEVAIFDVIEDTKRNDEKEEIKQNLLKDTLFEDKKSLLIVVSTPDANSILNFPLIYTEQALDKNSWNTITLLFFGTSVNSLIENIELKNKIRMFISKGIIVNYFDNFNDFYEKSEIEEIGITPNYDNEFITNAIKSDDWSVITV